MRYDKLRDAEAEARARTADRAKDDAGDKPLTFTKDRDRAGGDAKDKGARLRFIKDRGRDDDDRSR